MAWTAPATWIDGDVVSAADLNAQVRDNLRYLKGLDGVPRIESALELPEAATPTTPASGFGRLYFKTDGRLYGLNDGGTEGIILTRLGCRVYNNAAISVANSTDTVITFNSERYDDAGYHSTGANTGRITFPTACRAVVGCHIRFASNPTGYRFVAVRLNGTTNIGAQILPAASGVPTSISFSVAYNVASNDYVEVVVNQNSGGSLDVEQANNYSPEFWTVVA